MIIDVIDHLRDLRFHGLPERRENLMRRRHNLFSHVPRFTTHTTLWHDGPIATTTKLTANPLKIRQTR